MSVVAVGELKREAVLCAIIGSCFFVGSAAMSLSHIEGRDAGVIDVHRGSVFVSAPSPVGPAIADGACLPLRQMVKVSRQGGHTPRALTSQPQLPAAAEGGQFRLKDARVLLNCPIVQHAGMTLPGLR